MQIEKFSFTSYLRTKLEGHYISHRDAEGMTMRRWEYKEKRPTKVTIYNRHGARYRMSRAGVMHGERRRRGPRRNSDSNDARRNGRSGTETAIY